MSQRVQSGVQRHDRGPQKILIAQPGRAIENGEGGIRTHGTVTRTTVFEFYDSHAGACRLVAKRALWFGISPALLSQRGRKPDQWKRVQGMWVAMISTMWTARPTTGSPFSFSEAGTAPFDPMSSCFSLFGRLDPADPFIARERSNVFPRLQRFYVGGQCLFQVRGQVMDHAA